MAIIVLVTGTGTTRLGKGQRLSGLPMVFIGGEIVTEVVTGSGVGGTGGVTYYKLDNTNMTVYRLRCYEDITISPDYNDFEKWCEGALVQGRNLQAYSATIRVTDDTIDLEQLRILARQAAANYEKDTDANIERLTIDDLVQNWRVPVLFEQHYSQAGSTADQWVGLMAFSAELSIGDIPMDPTDGWSTELTISIARSDTYDGYLALMRHDDVDIV